MKITKNTLIRALRTFLQSALSYMLVNLAASDLTGDKDTVKTVILGLLISSVAAGLAAAMNLEKGDTLEA
ncbi:MAG: hypothetical protein IKF64_08050 [Eubacterium sp.]|nr:hypothetical protein [Eubacterium sp.]